MGEQSDAVSDLPVSSKWACHPQDKTYLSFDSDSCRTYQCSSRLLLNEVHKEPWAGSMSQDLRNKLGLFLAGIVLTNGKDTTVEQLNDARVTWIRTHPQWLINTMQSIHSSDRWHEKFGKTSIVDIVPINMETGSEVKSEFDFTVVYTDVPLGTKR